MRNQVFLTLSLLGALGCEAQPLRESNTAHTAAQASRQRVDTSDAQEKERPQRVAAKDESSQSESPSETADWWKVAPSEADNSSAAPPRRMGRVAISSDPEKHGDALRLRFSVNGTPISGVFQAPGGKNSTFAIPSGTVAFTVDECNWEEQGFPLPAGTEISLSCKLTKDGDCCEVAIAADGEVAAKEDAYIERHEKVK